MKYTKRILSLLLSLTLVLGLLPAGVLAADTKIGNVTFSIETKTIDGKYIVEPMEEELYSDDTVYTILSRVAKEKNLKVEGAETEYVTKIENFGSYTDSDYGTESGWMAAINNDHTTWPFPALKDGDTVRFCYTYKTYGYDIDLIDSLDQLRTLTQAAEEKISENKGNPFNENEGYLEDSDSKFNQLSAVHTEGYLKLEEIDALGTNQAYIESLTSSSSTKPLYGPGSETESIDKLCAQLRCAITGNQYVPATSAEITVSGNPTEYYVGRSYQFSAAITPSNATITNGTWKVNEITGTATISESGVLTPTKEGMIVVQYWHPDADYGVLATKFITVKPSPAQVQMPVLLDTIAASYTDSTDPWAIMEMGAYAKAFPGKSKLSDSARQNYINVAVNQIITKKIASKPIGDTGYDKIILALTANGIDPAQLYPVNSNTPVSAIAGLNSVTQSTSAWSAPYTLAAYQQKKDASTESYENALINVLLKAQQEDGSWNEFGTIDTTANVIAGLSFYAERADVSAAIEKGVNYLAGQMKPGGVYDGGYGANANSTAMVIVGLCAAGVNPDTDDRFINIKDGKSVLDGLLSFALEDNSGFGYQNRTEKNPGATEQAFRALIAASQVMGTGKAYNIYDFSTNQVEPGRATGSGAVQKPAEPDTEKTITVNFTLKSDVDYWIPTTNVTVKEGSTVYHAFTSALNTAGITYEGAESGYVSSITKGNKTLSEFSTGKNSGWLYKVNGELPEVGLTSYTIHNGDNIVFYYTNDWTLEPGAWTGKGDTTPAFSDVSVGSYYAEAVEWAVKNGITVGTSDTTFSPDDNCTREQMAMFLWKAAGSPEPKQTGTDFTDLPGGSTAKAMLWVAEQNITSGTSDTTFSPETTCTRAQMASFLYRYAGSPAVSGTCAFADVSAEAYYHDAVLWCAHQSITAGTGGDNFSPDAPCTRGQMVTFLYRFLGNHS